MKKIEINLDLGEKKSLCPLIFGNFIEHIENCILGGIYQKDSPLSDENGIRKDVLEKCQLLSPSILRFPGGTVIGIYHWEDHVGPLECRKKMRNIVWGDRLCHEFGTAEFVEYTKQIGSQAMICVNMATGSPEEAANWVEYCNGTEDTYYANLRRSHGYDKPFNVKYWCIGNESYAEPDLGVQHDVDTYIRDSWEFTKYMKMTDPTIELVYVGFDDEWNKKVLDSLGDVCDYLSLHFYASNTGENNQSFKMLEDFENTNLQPTKSLLDSYNKKEIKLNPWYRIPSRKKEIKIAIDEWNIWNTAKNEKSKYGLIQDYTWEDALWVASFLNMMMRNSDSVQIANMAQMVNVIAPIMATDEGSYCQTTFYPMMYYRKMAGDRVVYSSKDDLDLVVTENHEGYTAFIVNNSSEDIELFLPNVIVGGVLLNSDSLDSVSNLDKDVVYIKEIESAGQNVVINPYTINIINFKK